MGQPQLNRQTKLCPNTVTIITKQGAQTALQTAQHMGHLHNCACVHCIGCRMSLTIPAIDLYLHDSWCIDRLSVQISMLETMEAMEAQESKCVHS